MRSFVNRYANEYANSCRYRSVSCYSGKTFWGIWEVLMSAMLCNSAKLGSPVVFVIVVLTIALAVVAVFLFFLLIHARKKASINFHIVSP